MNASKEAEYVDICSSDHAFVAFDKPLNHGTTFCHFQNYIIYSNHEWDINANTLFSVLFYDTIFISDSQVERRMWSHAVI